MGNKKMYYDIIGPIAVGFTSDGNSFDKCIAVHGLQSVNIDTTFDLDGVFGYDSPKGDQE